MRPDRRKEKRDKADQEVKTGKGQSRSRSKNRKGAKQIKK
jgi:hypothetical protein